MEKQKNSTRQAGRDRVANRLATCILWAQKRWSDNMAAMMKKLSLKGRWVVCLCFVLLMAGLNCYLVVGSLFGKKKYPDSKVKISIPVLARDPVPAQAKNLPDDVYQRIKNFKAHLDSLGNTADGKRERDSILKGRQGLLDSISRIEELYQH